MSKLCNDELNYDTTVTYILASGMQSRPCPQPTSINGLFWFVAFKKLNQFCIRSFFS